MKANLSFQLKEKKEMDEQFKKAQKPWAKLYSKVIKASKPLYKIPFQFRIRRE
jgi:hypothetical protein